MRTFEREKLQINFINSNKNLLKINLNYGTVNLFHERKFSHYRL
jgi:hypothetical protein